jgi:hypothetical protein
VVTVGCARTQEDSAQQTVVAAIESRLAPQYWYLSLLLERARAAAHASAAGSAVTSEVESLLKELVDADERLKRYLEPRLAEDLRSKGVAWHNGPKLPSGPLAHRALQLTDVMPYAVLLAWPDELYSDGMPSMHICAGANGIAQLVDSDLELAAVAIAAVSGNEHAIKRMTRAFGLALASDEYKNAVSNADKVKIARREVKSVLEQDELFRGAVARQLTDKGSELKVACTDCLEIAAQAPVVATANASKEKQVVRTLPPELEEENEGLSIEEVGAIGGTAIDLPIVITGNFSLRGFLNLLENGSGLRYRFEDNRFPRWRGLQFNKWKTTTQGALIWLHKACQLRYRFGSDGRLVVRFAAPMGVSVPCGDGAMPISPQ